MDIARSDFEPRYTRFVSVSFVRAVAFTVLVAVSGAPTVAAACAALCFSDRHHATMGATADASAHLGHHSVPASPVPSVQKLSAARLDCCANPAVVVGTPQVAVRADSSTQLLSLSSIEISPLAATMSAAGAAETSPPTAPLSPPHRRPLVLRI